MSASRIRERRSLTPLLHQMRQRLAAVSPSEPEDSILLRVLVQALVTVGIVAMDVAAADIADPLKISFWAVPVSALGATWSYLRRRSRNIPVKFCIAIAMLAALAIFFMQLVQRETDTRLVLAGLLIQLQVFHSFDLPRRKDLGYSVVIGLILIGVAATVSQTLIFAPLLFLFLAIAIPILVLDYRSRLGLLPQNFKRFSADFSPKHLGFVLLITVGLGLTIFACLPRFPGYQLRSFPVSAPIQFQGQFDGSTILNSGYVRQGRSGTQGAGSSGNIETGPGQLDDTAYYGFNNRINQNLRGRLQPKILMRVRSQAPGFWRVMAFDRYTGQGWELSRNSEDQVQKLSRPPWSFRFLIPILLPLTKTREVVQSYTVVSDMPNVIPALLKPKELYFPTQDIAMDAEGGLRSPVPLSEGLTYTVVSEVSYRDRTLLSQAAKTYPRSIGNYYLQIPEEISDRVRQETRNILAKSAKPITAPSEQALYLAQYLKQNYTVQTDLPFFSEDEDLVDAFLFKYKGGYPDHFSTVLTVMLRSIGIPSRLVVGFGGGEFNPFTGFYVIRNTDAYAITEIFINRYGWVAFDPIPGHELVPPSIEESRLFGVLQQFWNWVAGWLPSPVTGVLSYVFEQVIKGLGWALGWISALFSKGWAGLLIALAGLTGLSFLGWLFWSGWQQWRYQRKLAKLPPMEALYQRLLKYLEAQGFRKPSAQTPLEYAQQMQGQVSDTHAKLIDEISQAYVCWRYGGHPPDLKQLKQQLRNLQQRSKRSGNRTQ
jgi:transglutaminase-like putative cysteine protease